MAQPSVTTAILVCGLVQGAAIYKARQAGTWPAPRTELGIVSVGFILLIATRISPMAKWFGIVIVLGAFAGIGTKPNNITSSGAVTSGPATGTDANL